MAREDNETNRENVVERLERLEREAQTSSEAKFALGHEKVRLGLVAGGLRDVLHALDRVSESEELDHALERLLGVAPRAASTARAPRAAGASVGAGMGTAQASMLSNDVVELARLGEALRVYARDVQLSRPIDAQLDATVQASIGCFDKAIGLGEASERPRDELAWLHAHRGAAKMMLYWLDLAASPSNDGDDALFEACASDFEKARELMAPAPYPWCLQFSAFLFALRGRDAPEKKGSDARIIDDFDRAIEFLRAVPPGPRQASLQRSVAMLASYNAVGTADGKKQTRKSLSARQEAARLSILEGHQAVEMDQDEFLAAYSVAVSNWALYDMQRSTPGVQTHEDEQTHRDELQRARRRTDEAVEAAKIRARNTISQALAALVGLSFVRARLAWDDDQHQGGESTKLNEAVQESIKLQKFFEHVQPDMETRAMFIRDPAWQAILQSAACRKAFANAGYDILRTIEYWRAKETFTAP